MPRQNRNLAAAAAAVTFCMALVGQGMPARAEAQPRECPPRESTDTFTGGKETIQFQNSLRYESVTFLRESGTPLTPDEGEVKALTRGVEQARLGTIEQGLSMREFGTVLIRLEPGVNPEGLQHILGRNAVAGRDRAKGTGNPIYDAGDVDYLLVNQVVVQFKASATQAAIDGLLAKYCARTLNRRERAGSWRHVLTFEGQTARHALAMTNRLAKEAMVEFAQPDFIVIEEADVRSGPTAAAEVTCPMAPPSGSVDPFFPQQWYLEHSSSGIGGDPNADINAPDAWAVADGDGAILAVLDDAVEVAHEDFTGRIHSQLNAFDGSNDLGITDDDTHGTAVAGIAGALTGNLQGIKGTAPKVKLMPVRVMRWIEARKQWEHPYTKVVDGIEMAAAAGAHVISMSVSLGKHDLKSCDNQNPPSCQGDLEAAIDALSDSTLLVFAAGNYGGQVVFPANLAGSMSNVIAVGATDKSDKVKTKDPTVPKDWGSSQGPEISVVAPGVEILTTDRTGSKGYCGGNYVVFLGTSAATPIVAGIAALMQSQYVAAGAPPLKPADLKSRIQATAVNLGADDFNEVYGHGRVDACRALKQDTCPLPP